jgi:hypothetical protein
MNKTTLLGTVLASLLAGGTALAAPGNAYRAPAAPARVIIAPRAAPMFARHDGFWTSLGEVVIGRGRFLRDADTLNLGRGELLTGLKLQVKRGAPLLEGVKITFASGQTYYARLPRVLPRDGSATIDLPGDARAVRSIEVVARSSRGRHGASQIEILGQTARFSHYRR